jgi:hypothetical protein
MNAMRSALITILLVVPLTAVLTAGATVFALRAMQDGARVPLLTPTLAATPIVEVAPPAPREAAPAPAAPAPRSTAAIGAVDYLRLTGDLKNVSTTLDRFNRKLLEALGAVEEPSRDDGADLGGGDHPTAVALDERKVPE